MVKRKRSSTSPTEISSAHTSDRDIARLKRLCTARLSAAHKPLIAALRLAAGFERQKHSRRQKTAKSENDEKNVTRIKAEYTALKDLSAKFDQVAEQYLRKTLSKVKSLRESEALEEYIAGGTKWELQGPELNVLARLYRAVAVKRVVDDVVQDLKGIIGGTAVASSSSIKEDKKPKKAKITRRNDADMPDVSDDEDGAFAALNARIAAPSSGEEDSEDSVSDNERPPSVGDSENEHDPEDDLEAESGSEEGESFHDFDSNQEDIEDKDAHVNLRLAPASDHSESDSDAPDEPTIPIPKPKTKAPKAANPTSSAFLPALSTSYLPGSESEASDLDEAPRKNRRGQRARQKIAELKHGEKAKHLEKQEQKQGWDPKRGAVSNDRRGGRRSQQTGENAIPLGKKKTEGDRRDDKGELHPSWQAAKLAKEKKMIKIDLRAPLGAGKKVVFD